MKRDQKLIDLTNRSSVVWEKSDVRKVLPIFQKQQIFQKLFEKLILELEMGWVREELGEQVKSGSIEITFKDENNKEIFCKGHFSGI